MSQVTAPALGAPYTNVDEAKRLKRRYQAMHHRVYSPLAGPHKVMCSSTTLSQLWSVSRIHFSQIYYHCASAETVLVWQTFGFDLYATFCPWESKARGGGRVATP